MTDKTDTQDKKPLTIARPGRLELKKTIETGQIRQSRVPENHSVAKREIEDVLSLMRDGEDFHEGNEIRQQACATRNEKSCVVRKMGGVWCPHR